MCLHMVVSGLVQSRTTTERLKIDIYVSTVLELDTPDLDGSRTCSPQCVLTRDMLPPETQSRSYLHQVQFGTLQTSLGLWPHFSVWPSLLPVSCKKT